MLNTYKIKRRFLTVLTLIISTGLLIICTHFATYAEQTKFQVHPLPLSLEKWQDNHHGDYFDQIKSTSFGYLIWSRFPVKVFIEIPKEINQEQQQFWVNSIIQAVKEWSIYLPLQIVENSQIANIMILRKAPALQLDEKGKILRARSALTSYHVYTENHQGNQILSHKFTILLSPSQTGKYILSAARHEIGHALGIWGHSQLQTDVLYFSQIRKPVSISARDVNTLKKIYQQSTSLGW